MGRVRLSASTMKHAALIRACDHFDSADLARAAREDAAALRAAGLIAEADRADDAADFFDERERARAWGRAVARVILASA